MRRSRAIAAALGLVGLLAAVAWQEWTLRAGTLQREVERLLQGRDGRYGVAVQTASGAILVDIGGRAYFPAASTIKLPLVLYLYHLAERQRLSLDDQLTYEDADYEAGTGWIQAESRTRYRLGELAEAAIRSSDNIAANMLTRRLGRRRLTRFMASMGARTVSRWMPRSTPRDMIRFLRRAHRQGQASALGARLIEHLKTTDFPGRLAGALPPGAVAHKIGTLETSVNDVGIVFGPPRRVGPPAAAYVAVLTEGVNPAQAEEAMEQIAALVRRRLR